MDEDFAQWYTDIVKKAQLIEYTSVKGCMVIRPYGYAIWELSGGEARLAELCLILLSEAPFYILDEPFSQIDPVNIEAVQRLIRERCLDHGIIVTDHNYDAISSVADNLFVISDGYTAPVHSRDDLVRFGYLR